MEAYLRGSVTNAQRLTSEAPMSNPEWREARPSRPYGGEPGARPRGDPWPPPGVARTPAAGPRTPSRDSGWGDRDARGSDPRGRDPGRGGRDSDPRGPRGDGRDPGPPAGRRGDLGTGDLGTGAQTRGRPAQPGVNPSTRPPRMQPAGTRPAMAQPGGARDGAVRDSRVRDGAVRDGAARDVAARDGAARDGAARDVAARDVAARDGQGRSGRGRSGRGRSATGPRNSTARRNSRRPGRRGRWGALQGGLGVCIIVASAAIGAIATMVVRGTPGVLLGLFVVAGTVAAALAVRPTTGRMLLPVPVLSYLVAALISGVIHDPTLVSSKTQLAVDAAQWIADGFFAMALATALAVVITAARWYLWRRRRPAPRAPRWPVAPAGTGRDAAGRRPAAWGTSAEPGHPRGFADPGGARETGPRRPAPGPAPRPGDPRPGDPRPGDPRPGSPAGRPQAGPPGRAAPGRAARPARVMWAREARLLTPRVRAARAPGRGRPRDVPDPGPTTSPAGRSGAPGA